MELHSAFGHGTVYSSAIGSWKMFILVFFFPLFVLELKNQNEWMKKWMLIVIQ